MTDSDKAPVMPDENEFYRMDHERRIVLLETEVQTVKSMIVEGQTEARLRAEFQAKKAEETSTAVNNRLDNMETMLSVIIAATRFFRWAGAVALSLIIFSAIWGERLIHAWHAYKGLE